MVTYLFKFIATPYQFENFLYRLLFLHWFSFHKYFFEQNLLYWMIYDAFLRWEKSSHVKRRGKLRCVSEINTTPSPPQGECIFLTSLSDNSIYNLYLPYSFNFTTNN